MRLAPFVLAVLAFAGGPSFAEKLMSQHHVTGPFDVKLAPLPVGELVAQTGFVRMSLDKRFHGALEATSRGEMLASGDGASGAGGYVALELVRGTLDGREGSFVLQHSSTMARGAAEQSVIVVPESGTGALAGLRGRMVIDVAPGGAHAYRFDYELP
jgi:Protein of unknown function (DUF3224)